MATWRTEKDMDVILKLFYVDKILMVFLLLICFSEHINLSFKIEISDDIFMIKKPKTVFFLRKVLTKQSE